jgi:hypothetical protein
LMKETEDGTKILKDIQVHLLKEPLLLKCP